jgi:hypothetical protein
LKPHLVGKTNTRSQTIWSAKVGLYKTFDWEFQSEHRYRIIVYPNNGFKPATGEKFKTKSVMTLKHIDIPIRDTAFEQMKILLGPKQLLSHQLIVEALVDKYNPKIKIEQSSLQIRH